jgi:hypothetical protein
MANAAKSTAVPAPAMRSVAPGACTTHAPSQMSAC